MLSSSTNNATSPTVVASPANASPTTVVLPTSPTLPPNTQSFSNSSSAFKLPTSDDTIWNIDLHAPYVPPTTFSLNVDSDIPFASSVRAPRIGRIADWTGLSAEHQRYNRPGSGRQSNTPLYAKHGDEDEGWSFSMADTRSSSLNPGIAPKKSSAKLPKGPIVSRITNNRSHYNRGPDDRGSFGARRGQWGQKGGFLPQAQRNREPSIIVPTEWKLIEEIEFSRLSKLQLDPDEPILMTGNQLSTRIYDRSFEKLSTKTEKSISIEGVPCFEPRPSPLEDPIIKEVMDTTSEDAQLVISTDSVLSIIMSSPRTVVPWDIIIHKRDKYIFFDRRSTSIVDLVSVNETALDPPADDREHKDFINSANSLAQEASRVNVAVAQLVAKSENSKEPANIRYTQWGLGNGINVIVQSESHGVTKALGTGLPQHVQVRSLLEYDPKSSMDWRQRLDTHRGAILAYEMKNNNVLMARWVFQAMLAHIDSLKLAYVSRTLPRDKTKHVILGLQDFDPQDLASQMSLNIPNGFGIVRALVDMCRNLPNGDYCLLRDPNKPLLRLYSCN